MENNKITAKILHMIESQDLITRYSNLTLALFISSLNFNILLNPFRIIAAGSGGIATILDALYGINPSIVIFIVTAILTILSLIFLDINYALSMIYVSIVYPLFVQFTSGVTNLLVLETNDLLLISIFAGIISGITSGIIYRNGLATGGFSAIARILEKYKYQSMTKVTFLLNALVVAIGGIVIGLDKVLYAIIYLYISRIVSDKILLGTSNSKTMYIVSSKYKEIVDVIMNEYNRGTTIFDAKGGNNLEKKKTLMTVVPTKEYISLKKKIDEIDKKAFVVIIDSYEVKGGK